MSTANGDSSKRQWKGWVGMGETRTMMTVLLESLGEKINQTLKCSCFIMSHSRRIETLTLKEKLAKHVLVSRGKEQESKLSKLNHSVYAYASILWNCFLHPNSSWSQAQCEVSVRVALKCSWNWKRIFFGRQLWLFATQQKLATWLAVHFLICVYTLFQMAALFP